MFPVNQRVAVDRSSRRGGYNVVHSSFMGFFLKKSLIKFGHVAKGQF